ncbi:sulfotransferase 1B1-like isoform X1 [Hemitrygon akajei]|uniref:sulfotransferase 1B1-like isoform X1 n=2 Tax=Hemitrygon akajei TaxID=2704970 RepID=UPI003BFA2BDB
MSREEAKCSPTGAQGPMASTQKPEEGSGEGEAPSKVPRPRLVLFQGVPMVDIFLEGWEEVENFPAHPSDIIIATYPKAGTTWVQEIVDSIMQGGDVKKCLRAPVHSRIPFLEFKYCGQPRTTLQQLLNTPPPRVIKTHLPFQLLPKSFLEQGCKMIYCARNAKDLMVSYFHFDLMNQLQPDPGTWQEYFQRFLEGNVSYGPWHHHVRGWWDQRKCHPILYLFYEDLKEDLKREVVKIARFLEKQISDSALDSIVQHTTFESMKDNPMCNYSSVSTALFDTSVSRFMRKGQVGNWKDHFTVAQDQAFEMDYQCKMKDTDLRFRTEL